MKHVKWTVAFIVSTYFAFSSSLLVFIVESMILYFLLVFVIESTHVHLVSWLFLKNSTSFDWIGFCAYTISSSTNDSLWGFETSANTQVFSSFFFYYQNKQQFDFFRSFIFFGIFSGCFVWLWILMSTAMKEEMIRKETQKYGKTWDWLCTIFFFLFVEMAILWFGHLFGIRYVWFVCVCVCSVHGQFGS